MALTLWLFPSRQVSSTHWSPVSNWNKDDWMRLVVFKFCCPLFEQNFMQNSKIGVARLKANAGVEAFGPYSLTQATPTSWAKKQENYWPKALSCHAVLVRTVSHSQNRVCPTLFSPFKCPLYVISSEKPSLTMFSNTISYFLAHCVFHGSYY